MTYRKIIHIDMDAFFASVEQHDNPRLKGLPVAVGYDGKRGVVATASYEARKYGVRSAMPMSRAHRLCPNLVIVPCHFNRYKEVSAIVHSIFHEYTDIIEPISLDEAFLDVTENKKGILLARDIALEIKRKIKEQTGLTASAGVSYNKFLAKIASDFHKPDGLTTVHPLRALKFIETLPIEDFWGVGPKTAEKMHRLGIYNGAQLRLHPLGTLTANFGKAGKIYYDFARGIDNRPVQTTRIRKSVGCEETFPDDIYRDEDISEAIAVLITDLVRRIDRSGFEGRTLTVKAKFQDFTIISRSTSLTQGFYTDKDTITAGVNQLLPLIDYSQRRPLRLLGLSVSHPIIPDNLHSEKATLYPSLFDDLELVP